MSHANPHHHPTPETVDVFRTQLALLTAPPRRGMAIGFGLNLLQVVLLASVGYILGISVHLEDGNASVARLTHTTDLGVDEGIAALVFAFVVTLLWGVFWPLRVARDSRGSGHGYHWSLPVDRRIHDLLRVAAGAVGLVPISTVFPLTVLVVATLSGHGEHLTRFPATAWIAFFLCPQLAYLLASIPSLMKGRRQLVWLWFTLGAWVALFGLLAVAGSNRLFEELFVGPFGLVRALAGPFLSTLDPDSHLAQEPWLPAFLVWLTLALIGILGAASDRGRNDG